MAPHVYARLSGYGLLLVPFAPYRFEALSDGRSLAVTHSSPEGHPEQVLVVTTQAPERGAARAIAAAEELAASLRPFS